MSSPDESLRSFLGKRREKPTQHLVIGNKAGDADSIVSALAAAYLADDEATPVVSISQNDLMTQRPETMLLFKMAGIETTDLWFTDQLESLSSETVSLTLVDHNRLDEPSLEQRGHVVKAIYDHHMDEGYHKDTATIRDIAFTEDGKPSVASTCTLMVEKNGRKLAGGFVAVTSGGILIDSVNMSPDAGKVTPRDEAAVEKLLQGTNWQHLDVDDEVCVQIHPQPSTSGLFDALQNAKFDPLFWNSLSLVDALRLDYKSFKAAQETFGISTVLLPASSLLDREGVLCNIEAFMKRMHIEFLGIMLAYSKDAASPLTRELILCGKDASAGRAWLEGEGSLRLCVREQFDSADKRVIVLDQGNSRASRKQVAPLLIQFFQTRE